MIVLEVFAVLPVRQLGAAWYTPDQIASSLRFMFGVDTQLIDDGTYMKILENWGVQSGAIKTSQINPS